MRITRDYVFFWGGPFSNWYASEFELDGHKFSNSEQAFMWRKAIEFNDTEIAERLLVTLDPKEAKKLGRKIKGFDNKVWETVRTRHMCDCLRAKFKQNPALSDTLLGYERKIFVEASPFDTIWGIGMREDEEGVEDSSNWKGLNLLGECLGIIRLEILTLKLGSGIF